jgi:hypothetical protein
MKLKWTDLYLLVHETSTYKFKGEARVALFMYGMFI